MNTLLTILFGVVYIIVTGSNLLMKKRGCFPLVVVWAASIIPVFNLFYLLYRMIACGDCTLCVHANAFFRNESTYNAFIQNRERIAKMKSDFNNFKKTYHRR